MICTDLKKLLFKCEPFGTLDGHAKRLYEEAKEHFFDVPVANDMRKFIAGYLGKGGDA